MRQGSIGRRPAAARRPQTDCAETLRQVTIRDHHPAGAELLHQPRGPIMPIDGVTMVDNSADGIDPVSCRYVGLSSSEAKRRRKTIAFTKMATRCPFRTQHPLFPCGSAGERAGRSSPVGPTPGRDCIRSDRRFRGGAPRCAGGVRGRGPRGCGRRTDYEARPDLPEGRTVRTLRARRNSG